MNLNRFQLALNHDDPSVVSTGLNEFKVQVLAQHNAVSSIGYHGRSCAIGATPREFIHPISPQAIQGLLLEYVQKSPQVEELFVLWALPGRDEDRALSAAHMSCIAAIIHCSTSNSSFCNAIVSRILCDHMKSLHSQLASGNVELVHSTLGLLLAMMRTSQQNCKDVFQKLNLSNPALDAVIQKGKTVNYQCAKHQHAIATDSRLLVIMLVLLVLEASDATAVLELFAEKSLMRKVMHSIGRDSLETLQIVLPGVLWTLQQNPVLAPHVHDIFDGATIRQLVLLYSHKEEAAQALAQSFLVDLLGFLKHPSATRGKASGGAAVASSVSKCCGYVAQHLQPHADLRQEEILMLVLSIQPHLLNKSISSISTLKSWDPVPSSEYLGIMRYLTQLLQAAAIDGRAKSQLRSAFALAGPNSAVLKQEAGEHAETDATQKNPQSVLNALLNSWIPPGLTKKDICKMLAHKELSLQRVGLQYVHVLAARLQRAITEAGLSTHCAASARQSGSDPADSNASAGAMLDHCVAAAIQTYLPEFQLLVNLRSKYVKQLADSREGKTESAAVQPRAEAVAVPEVMDDFDFNIEGADQAVVAVAAKAELEKLSSAEVESEGCNVYEALYVLLLQVVEIFMSLSPQSVTAVKFDMLRVLDDFIPWETSASCARMQESVQNLNQHVLLAILQLLRQATGSVECRWFGTQDDAVKMLINLIVSEDWRLTLKRSVLMKLMVLASPPNNSQSPELHEVSKRARSLLKSVLMQSGLFVGHGLLDLELNTELHAWLSNLSTMDDSILLTESLLRLSHHWNTEIGILSSQSLAKAAGGKQSQRQYVCSIGLQSCADEEFASMPYSPMLFCSMLLLSSNFQVFASLLPKHVKTHIQSCFAESDSAPPVSTFFDKYNAQFRSAVERLFSAVFCKVVGQVRDCSSYCVSVYAGLGCARSTLPEMASKTTRGITALLDALGCGAASGTTTDGKQTPKKGAAQPSDACERLQVMASAVPEVHDALMALLSNDSSEDKKKNSSSKKVSKSSGSEAEATLSKALLRIDLYPSLLAGLLVHSSALGEAATASPALSGFLASNWKVIFAVQLRAVKSGSTLDSKYFAWAREVWEVQRARADGLHAKALLLHDALQNLHLLSALVGDKCFQFTATEELVLSPSFDVADSAPRSARKRTQSDLSTEGQSLTAAISLPLCQSLIATVLQVLQSSVGASPMVSVILSNSALVEALLQTGWYGQWIRRLFLTVGAAARDRKQTVLASARKRAANLSQEGTLTALWKRLGDKIVAADQATTSVEASQELQKLSTVITQLVNMPALRKLVVDSSVAEQNHAVLGQMHLSPAQAAPGVPAMSVVEGITEDVLRSAPLTQIVKSLEELIGGTLGEDELSSALLSTMYREEDLADKVSDAYYFDPLSLLQSGQTSMSPQATSLFLCNTLGRPAELPLVKKSKITAEHVHKALLYESVLPVEVVRDGASVTSVVDLLMQKWDNLPLTVSMAPDHVMTDVLQLVDQEMSTTPNAALRSQLLSLVAAGATDAGVSYILAQYLAYMTKVPSSSWSALVPITLSEKLLSVSQYRPARADQWARAFSAAVVSSIDACLATLSELAAEDITINTKAGLFDVLANQLQDFEHLLRVRVPSAPQYVTFLQESSAALKKKTNKLIKAALKGGIESPAVLRFIAQFHSQVFASATDAATALLGAILQPAADDFYFPATQLSLIPGHSKFAAILSINKDTHHPAKLPMLNLLLQMVLIVYKDRDATEKKQRKEKINPVAQYLLADSLVSIYCGTLSEADRVILRILIILSEANRCPSVFTLQPRAAGSVMTAAGPRSAEELLVDSARWLVEGISPPMTYSTLARFPLWRSLAPQPLHRIESAFLSSAKKVVDKAGVEREWKGGDETDVEADEDGDRASDAGDGDDETMTTPMYDALLQCSDKVLDPAFYVPAMFFVLRNKEVSIRQMANSGALSLLIAALGSSCPALRSCALACLQFVLNMLHQQNPTRDAAFRERSQLVLLLNYVRNSFDPAELVVPHLPLTTAIFLGRAAMNVMQPNHELFGRVNKYLLNRPFCDPKDVPLYDLLLVNGDAQSDQMQRLAALRLFRDGLFTKQDHLNLCRKNAYNRLMLLFPLLAKDTRAGHAVLDLLDKGLCMKVSARYLLERCRVSAWIKLLAAPMSAMHLSATAELDGVLEQPLKKASDSIEAPGLASYSKYLVRALTLMRRVIAAGYLLACEDDKTKGHLQDVHMICIAVVNEVVMAVNSGYADTIPAEFFTQLVLCLWDLSLVMQKVSPTPQSTVLWNASMIQGLYQAIQVKFANKSHALGRSPVNQDELSLSLLLLLRFTAADVDGDYSDLFVQIRRLSLQLLLVPPTAPTAEKCATAIMSATQARTIKKKPSVHQVPLHHLLDNPAQLPYYSNTVHYLAAVMGSTTLGIDDFDIQSHFEFSWTTLAGTDLINMTALPTSLGKQFVLDSAAAIFGARNDAIESDSLAFSRWALLLWTAYGKATSLTGFARTKSTLSDADILSIEQVAQAVLPFSSLQSSAALCLVAARGLTEETTGLTVSDEAFATLVAVSANLASALTSLPTDISEQVKLENLVARTFELMSAMVTLTDHPANRDGSISVTFRSLLESRASTVATLCTPAVATLPEDNGATAQRVSLSSFLDDALQSGGKASAQAAAASQQLLLGIGATYMPLQYARQITLARTSRGVRADESDYAMVEGGQEEQEDPTEPLGDEDDQDASDDGESMRESEDEGGEGESSGDEDVDSDVDGTMDEN